MTLLGPAIKPIRAPAISLGAVRWVGDRHWPVQVGLGIVVAVAYLVANGAELGVVLIVTAAGAVAIAAVWPVAGLTVLAVLIPMREPELFKPIYIDAALVGATTLGCLLRLPGDRRPLQSIRESSLPSGTPSTRG